LVIGGIAAVLHGVVAGGNSFNEAAAAESHYHSLMGDEVFLTEFQYPLLQYLGSALIPIFGL
jgi:hypothetical protein